MISVGLAGVGMVHPEIHGQDAPSTSHAHADREHGSEQAACAVDDIGTCEADKVSSDQPCGLDLAHCPSVFLLSAGYFSDRILPGKEWLIDGPGTQLMSRELGFDPPPPKTV